MATDGAGEDKYERKLEEAARALGRKLLSKEETKKEASRLLLEGWTMLGDSCPVTEYPLFKNKKTNEIWSVRLQMPVKIAEEGGREQSDNAAQEQSKKKEASGGGEPRPLVQSTPQSSRQPSTNELSAIIGEKLLLGWEMLNEHIDGYPVLLDPEAGRKWNPATKQYLDGVKPVDHVGNQEPLARGKRVEPFAAPVPQPTSSHPEEDSAIADRISVKLLEGWEMLNESCPISNSCPLMRDPVTGRKWSAFTSTFIDDNADDSDEVQDNAHGRTIEQRITEVKIASLSDDQVANEAIRSALNEQLMHCSSLLKIETDLGKTKQLLDLVQQILSIRTSVA